MPASGPYRYCLAAIDRFTSWTEVEPFKNITAEIVADALLRCWISRFGVPVRITTDQGRQFESKLFAKLGIHTGFEQSRTTAYNAKCDGIERFFRHLKSAFMCHNGSTWYDPPGRPPRNLLSLQRRPPGHDG